MIVSLHNVSRRLGNGSFECDSIDVVTDESYRESLIITQEKGQLDVNVTNSAEQRIVPIPRQRLIELAEESFMETMGGLIVTHTYMNGLPKTFSEKLAQKIKEEEQEILENEKNDVFKRERRN